MKSIYLDYAAATPVDPAVIAAMQPYLSVNFYNPSATYLVAQSVKHDVDQARARIARSMGVRPREIIFTAGGTEANNLAIQGVMNSFPGSHLVVSAVEHKSVIEPAGLFDYTLAAVDADGRVNIAKLAKTIRNNTVLVSVMLANNEVGVLQPLSDIAKLLDIVREQRSKAGNALPIYLHTDACQAPNYLSVLPHSLGVDLMTLNGGKVYGPKQTGLLYVKTGVKIKPIILGGGQEWGVRSGTENVAGIIGFTEALVRAIDRHQTEAKRMQDLQKSFIKELGQKLPNALINGSLKHRIANNIHVTFPGVDNERLMMELDELGVQCAVGSACTASSDEPSHVLMAMGITQADAQSSLRFSMGRQTRQEDVQVTIKLLASLVNA